MKRTYSIQLEIFTLVILAVVAVALLVGGMAVDEISGHVHQTAEELLTLTCENESVRINTIFEGMEKSVRIMETYALGFIGSKADARSELVQEQIVAASKKMFSRVAENTDGAVAYYLRFAPEISDHVSGLFYSKTTGSESFLSIEVTDLSKYPKDDREHVGWYWEPYEKGAPLWMTPYYNKNNDILMISYVIPMYYEDLFVGVVGIDFDYNVLTDMVRSICIYENGYAQLELGNEIAFHETLQSGTSVPDVTQTHMTRSQELQNGMRLTVCVSRDDISRINREIVNKMGVIVVIFSVFLFTVVALFVQKLVSPIKRLTDLAAKLSRRNYEVEIIHSRTREIELLSTAFENMAALLSEHDKLQHIIAYRDSLTGLRNTTAYKTWVEDFDKNFGTGESMDFGVIVLDINYLKETNDRYGHDMGNKLISGIAGIISDIFVRCPVFRIGGDEFLIILRNRDLEERERLIGEMQARFATESIATEAGSIPLSAACGVALYDAERDKSFLDVFNRADDLMYKNKREMKSGSAATFETV